MNQGLRDPGDEVVALVDEQNQVIGEASRRQMRRDRLLHRATYLLVFNSSGQLFLQKRTLTKDVYPGYWDPAAGGVVLASESYEEGASRELKEELGISAKFTFLFDFKFTDSFSSVWGRAYHCIYDGELILQSEEIENGIYVPPPEAIQLSLREPFTPDGVYVLRRYMGLGY
jgi:isopentenyldiphosphate isomerase